MLLTIYYTHYDDLINNEQKLLKSLLTCNIGCITCLASLLNVFYEIETKRSSLSCTCHNLITVKNNLSLLSRSVSHMIQNHHTISMSNFNTNKMIERSVLKNIPHDIFNILFTTYIQNKSNALYCIDWQLIVVEFINIYHMVDDNDEIRKCLLLAISNYIYKHNNISFIILSLLMNHLAYIPFHSRYSYDIKTFKLQFLKWITIPFLEHHVITCLNNISNNIISKQRISLEKTTSSSIMNIVPFGSRLNLADLPTPVIFERMIKKDMVSYMLKKKRTLLFKKYDNTKSYSAAVGPYKYDNIKYLIDMIYILNTFSLVHSQWKIMYCYEKIIFPDNIPNISYQEQISYSLGKIFTQSNDKTPTLWLVHDNYISSSKIRLLDISCAQSKNRSFIYFYYLLDDSLLEIDNVNTFISQIAKYLVLASSDPIDIHLSWLSCISNTPHPFEEKIFNKITDLYHLEYKSLLDEYEYIKNTLLSIKKYRYDKMKIINITCQIKMKRTAMKKSKKTFKEQKWYKYAPSILGDPINIYLNHFKELLTDQYEVSSTHYIPSDILWNLLKIQIDKWNIFIQKERTHSELSNETLSTLKRNISDIIEIFKLVDDPKTPLWLKSIILSKILFGDATWITLTIRIIENIKYKNKYL